MSSSLSSSLAWLINQVKPSQAELKLFGIITSSSSNIVFRLEYLIFIDESNSNIHFSTKLDLFTALCMTNHKSQILEAGFQDFLLMYNVANSLIYFPRLNIFFFFFFLWNRLKIILIDAVVFTAFNHYWRRWYGCFLLMYSSQWFSIHLIICVIETSRYENPAFCVSRFFFFRRAPQVGSCTIQWVPCTIYRTHKHFFLTKFLLKMGPTVLFTHLKNILLQYFLFSAK